MGGLEKQPRGKQLREYQGIETDSIYDGTQRRGYEAAKALYVLFTILFFQLVIPTPSAGEAEESAFSSADSSVMNVGSRCPPSQL